jgi:polyisoprenoid-binding protein YceI
MTDFHKFPSVGSQGLGLAHSVALLALVAGLCGLSSESNGQAYRTVVGDVRFTSSVPLHTFDGKSSHLVGRISLVDSTVDFYVDLTTLKTGIGKRDKDMRKTLETNDYPFAEFFGRLISPFDASTGAVQPAIVVGDFAIHGVTRPIEVQGTLTRNDQGLLVSAAWTINLKDYNIEPPSLLIMKVDELQQVRIEAQLKWESERQD